MRTAKAKIHDKEYLICFSTRVLMALEEREGDSSAGLEKIMKTQKVSDVFWLLAQMIDAGDRYAKIEGIENPGTISYDELVDTLGVDEYQDVFGAIAEAVQKGTKPDVQTKPAKNAKTTRTEK